ncbi:MAG: type 1 glutamine amidotransferase [Verrucomicrobiales bacterium]|jgi:type 1 glutamine amidotransferase
MPRLILFVLALGFSLLSQASAQNRYREHTPSKAEIRVLCFSASGWYRHPDIPAINHWLVKTGAAYGIQIDVSETAKDLTEKRLADYNVLLLNNANTLDKVFDEEQREVIEDWYAKGGGIVGLHAALVHQQGWQWFHELAGCDFDSDSDYLEAHVVVDPKAKDHPSVKGQPDSFLYKADWTNHTKTVTGLAGVQVLLRVDETSYEPVRKYFQDRGGKAMGTDHPIAWTRVHGGGRFFYTELGHDVPSLDTDFGRQHLIEGILWAAEKSK